ncbi:MAG: hypothetical protein PHF51_02710 [Candidatus ainarchaeum sp.]|nr:hypothetical protein [Candidatus ainarchaeum sp.]
MSGFVDAMDENGDGEEAGKGEVEILGIIFPRWVALLAAILLLAALLLLLMYLPSALSAGRSSPPAAGNVAGAASPSPVPTPQQTNFSVSPLTITYAVDSVPTLVFGCSLMRVGTWADLEYMGLVSPGMERQGILNALCQATGRTVFCGESTQEAEPGVYDTGMPDCFNATGKIPVIAFHSPSCPGCAAQKPVLQALMRDFGGELEMRYVCAPIDQNDSALCASAVGAGQFDE